MFGILAPMTHQEKLQLRTSGHRDMHDITAEVAEIVERSQIRTGTANVFNIGSTACVGTIEYERGLASDLPAMLARLIPPSHSYGHELAWHDGNGHSHLQATMMGPTHGSGAAVIFRSTFRIRPAVLCDR